MLEISGLTKSYGSQRALGEVDLAVTPGEVLGLLGPNGAGETTMASIVAASRRRIPAGSW
jgi:ABC-2 type transport system ATP-binding protein